MIMVFGILSQIEFVPVIASVVVSFLLGWLYYSPAVAGKTWMKLQKIDPRKAKGKSGMGKMMVGILVALFVSACTISYLVNSLGVTSIVGGVGLGLFMWLGLVASTMAMNYMHGKSLGLYTIDVVYHAITFAIAGAIIVAF